MRNSMKVASMGDHGPRGVLGDIFGTIKRTWTEKAARRVQRPLEDVDGWSDQAEVAFYEDSRAFRYG